jgi:hypothetical protein
MYTQHAGVRLVHSCSGFGPRRCAVPTTMPRCSPMAARRLFHSSRSRRSRPYFSTYALHMGADTLTAVHAVAVHAHDAVGTRTGGAQYHVQQGHRRRMQRRLASAG